MKKYISAAALAAVMLLSSCSGGQETKKITITQQPVVITGSVAIADGSLPASAETAAAPETEKTAEETSAAAEETAPEETAEEESSAPNGASATIAFVGDVTQSDVFGDTSTSRGIQYPFEDVADIFSSADLAFLNLETCVSKRGQSEKNAGFGFQTAPEKLELLNLAGIDIVSTANNHVRDYGMDALGDTFANLDEYGIDYVGAGNDLETAQRLRVHEVNGIKIGFTACNTINMNPTWYATGERAGLNCIDVGTANAAEYLDKIAQYKKQCDVLIVSVHWGIEYYNEITEEQEQFAHELCDSGADIIFGHHPHVLEPVENYNGKAIFYSLGNFLFYKMDDDAGKTAIFTIEVDKNGFVSGRMQPVFISYCKSVLLKEDSEMYSEIIKLVSDLSESRGVDIDGNGGISFR